MLGKTRRLLFLTAFITLFAPIHAHAYSSDPLFENQIENGQPTLAVFGDSISTGVLANTELGQGLPNSLWKQLLKLLFSKWSDPASVHTALANPLIAAASTREDYGLRKSLKDAYGLSDLGVLNFARFGARARHVPAMIENLNSLETMDLGRKADYIFLMIGANDFCSNSSVEDFKTDFEGVLNELESSHPDAHFVIAPIPPVDQLADLRDFLTIHKSDGTRELISCEYLRRNYCARLYDTDAKERKEAMNQVIENAVQNMETPRKIFAKNMAEWTARKEEVSADCFHPSGKGQIMIGNILKEAIAIGE